MVDSGSDDTAWTRAIQAAIGEEENASGWVATEGEVVVAPDLGVLLLLALLGVAPIGGGGFDEACATATSPAAATFALFAWQAWPALSSSAVR